MTSPLLLRFWIISRDWYTRIQLVNMTKPDIHIWSTIQRGNKYTATYDTPNLYKKTYYTSTDGGNHSAWSSWLFNSVKKSDIGRKSSMLDHFYQLSIRIYEIPRINSNNLMTEKRAYILSKRLWQRKLEMSGRGYSLRLKRPINRDIWVITQKNLFIH